MSLTAKIPYGELTPLTTSPFDNLTLLASHHERPAEVGSNVALRRISPTSSSRRPSLVEGPQFVQYELIASSMPHAPAAYHVDDEGYRYSYETN